VEELGAVPEPGLSDLAFRRHLPLDISLKQGFGLERISVGRLKWWSDPFKLSERLDQVCGRERHFAAIPSTFANAAYVNR